MRLPPVAARWAVKNSDRAGRSGGCCGGRGNELRGDNGGLADCVDVSGDNGGPWCVIRRVVDTLDWGDKFFDGSGWVEMVSLSEKVDSEPNESSGRE